MSSSVSRVKNGSSGKSFLVTGGAGFVGANIAIALKHRFPKSRVVCIDNLYRKGSRFNLGRLSDNGIDFIRMDVRNREDILKIKDVSLVISCCAEPSVLAGYDSDPRYLIDTNLCGTVNCLELARVNKADLIFFSTSRVYPYDAINNIPFVEKDTRFVWDNQYSVEGFSDEGIAEEFPLSGRRSLYGATKLCSEHLITEYCSIYGIRAVINRCGVISGPWQFGKVDQGVFALWMMAHYFKRNLSYIGFGGAGKQVRDLLHIDDLIDLIFLQISDMDKFNNGIFNVGGGTEVSLSLAETTSLCREITGNKLRIDSDSETRPADISVYLTDNRKINGITGWKPKLASDKIMEDIYVWIRNNESVVCDL